jgi:hypothetical protein
MFFIEKLYIIQTNAANTFAALHIIEAVMTVLWQVTRTTHR